MNFIWQHSPQPSRASQRLTQPSALVPRQPLCYKGEMPRGKQTTSTPVKARNLDTTEEIREYAAYLSDIDYSGDEGNSDSGGEESDEENDVEMDQVTAGSDHDISEEEEMADAPQQGNINVCAWSNNTRFQPNIPVFDSENSGVQAEFPVIDDDAEEVEYFMAYFDILRSYRQ